MHRCNNPTNGEWGLLPFPSWKIWCVDSRRRLLQTRSYNNFFVKEVPSIDFDFWSFSYSLHFVVVICFVTNLMTTIGSNRSINRWLVYLDLSAFCTNTSSQQSWSTRNDISEQHGKRLLLETSSNYVIHSVFYSRRLIEKQNLSFSWCVQLIGIRIYCASRTSIERINVTKCHPCNCRRSRCLLRTNSKKECVARKKITRTPHRISSSQIGPFWETSFERFLSCIPNTQNTLWVFVSTCWSSTTRPGERPLVFLILT